MRRCAMNDAERAAAFGWLRRMPRLCWTAVQLVWVAARREFLACLVLRVFSGSLLGVILLLAKGALTGLVSAGRSGGDVSHALPQLVMLMSVAAGAAFIGALARELHVVLTGLVERYAQEQVIEVASAVELEYYETPTFHDLLMRAASGGQQRPMQVVDGLLGLVSSTLGIAAISIALLTVQPWLIPVVVVAALPLLAAAAKGGDLLFNFTWSMTPADRERLYLYQLLTTKEPAKEVRAFALAAFLGSRHRQLYDRYLAELRRTARRRLRLSLQGILMTSLMLAGAAVALLWMSAHDRLDLATAGVAIAATLLLTERLVSGAAGAGRLYEGARFIDDFASFLRLRVAMEAKRPRGVAPRGFSRLAVEHVTFTYPSGHHPALCDVSLEVRQGQVVALVGGNGSGKTTLAKLLCRLYLPQAGRICWDGVDVAGFDPDQLRGSIAVIFQDFARYALPAHANIGLGRVDHVGDRDGIVAAAEHAGAHSFLAELPKGYETVLSPEYDGGKDLSIGQWQRVALARAFFRDAPFLILDEPTAALDARAEYELFEAIRTLCRGRTVLLISHRFSSVRSADLIYVLDGGRIIEQGTHEQLMSRADHYADLFTLQASAYLSEDGEKGVGQRHAGCASRMPDERRRRAASTIPGQ